MQVLSLIQNDTYLKPFEQQIVNRIEWYQSTKDYIEKHFGSLERFASAHQFYGFNYDEQKIESQNTDYKV